MGKLLVTLYIYIHICMASRSFPVGAKTTFPYISCNVFGELAKVSNMCLWNGMSKGLETSQLSFRGLQPKIR